MPRDLYIYTHECFPKRGGIATYCHEFATAATELGHRATVVGPNGAKAPEGSNPPYRIQAGNNRGTHNPSCLWRTRTRLRAQLKQSPDAIHLLAEPGPILAYGMLPEKYGTARVQLTLHGSEVQRWRSNPLSKIIARRAFRNAHAIHAVSTPVLESLLLHFPEAAGKTTVVHNALPEAFRGEVKLPPGGQPASTNAGTMQLLSVGRIHPRKGFDQIISALAQLSGEEKAAIHTTIAGASKDQAYLAHLKRMADDANIQIQWVLNPNDAELRSCYAAADVFALTSMPRKKSVEGFGIVYLEAGAYALPCLAYDTGGVREAIQDTITGFLVDVGNSEQLAEHIQFFLQHPNARLQMGESNRDFALSRTWKHVVEESLMR